LPLCQVTNLSGYLYKFSKDERRVKCMLLLLLLQLLSYLDF
jgi:hypothetical protein